LRRLFPNRVFVVPAIDQLFNFFRFRRAETKLVSVMPSPAGSGSVSGLADHPEVAQTSQYKRVSQD